MPNAFGIPTPMERFLQEEGGRWGRIAREGGQGLPAWALGAGGAGGGMAGVGPGPVPGQTPGILPGAPPRAYSPAHGGIPQVTDPSVSLQNLISAIGGNLENLAPIIKGLTGSRYEALKDEYPASFFTGIGTGLENINRRLEGDIQDLFPVNALDAAEWGAGRGVSGAPISDLHLRSLLGKTRYDVMRDANKDLALMKGTIPTVEPFDVSKLIPDAGLYSAIQAWADTLGAAPQPAASAADAWSKMLAGILAGRGAGGGGAGGGFGGGFTPSPRNFSPGGVPAFTPAATPAATPPPSPGWGFAFNDRGGFAGAGNIPPNELERFGFNPDLSTPDWDQFFDLSIEEPFMEPEFDDFWDLALP